MPVKLHRPQSHLLDVLADANKGGVEFRIRLLVEAFRRRITTSHSKLQNYAQFRR